MYRAVCAVLLLYTALGIINFGVCNKVSYEFPPVDVVRIVSEYKYLLFHQIYDRNLNDVVFGTTIVVVPKLHINDKRILLEYAEGIYTFATKSISVPPIQLTTALVIKHGGTAFEFVNPTISPTYTKINTFIKQNIGSLYLHTDLAPSKYQFEKMMVYIYLTNLFHVITLFCTCINIGCMVVPRTKLSLNIVLSIFLVCTGICAVLSFSSFVISTIMAAKFPNIHSISNIFIYFGQSVAFVYLVWFMKEVHKKEMAIIEAKVLMATFEPSPEYNMESVHSSPNQTLDPFVHARSSSFNLPTSPKAFEPRRWFSEPTKLELDSFDFN